jgi:hypothetical protein
MTSQTHANITARLLRRGALSAVLRLKSVALALALSVGYADAQLPERRLPAKPEAVTEEPFSDLRSVRELADGRLLVLDMRDQTIQLVDLDKGTAEAVARRGKGPGEYAQATALVPWPGDSTAVVDAETGRLLLVDPRGKAGRVVTEFPNGVDARPGAVSVADGRGLLYLGVMASVEKAGTFVMPDSQALMRLDPSTGRMARIATIALVRSEVKTSSSGGKLTGVQIFRIPFSVGDEWDVAPDGRVAIARRAPYRLDQIMADGRVVRGPEVSVPTLEVTEADRKEFISGMLNATPARIAAIPWPKTRPPFPARAVIALPGGETWVRRNQTAGAKTTIYDVFGAVGRPVTKLVLPADRRVIAASARWIYVAKTDGDGLQYLERYARI